MFHYSFLRQDYIIINAITFVVRLLFLKYKIHIICTYETGITHILNNVPKRVIARKHFLLHFGGET